MNLNVSNELNDILSFAREESMRLGSYIVTNDHLLLGIIRHANNRACQMFTEMGISLPQLKSVIEEKYKGLDMLPLDQVERLSLSKTTEQVLKSMYLEARTFNQLMPTSEHLLLALLLPKEGVGTQWLRQHGVTYFSLRVRLKGLNPGTSAVDAPDAPSSSAENSGNALTRGSFDSEMTDEEFSAFSVEKNASVSRTGRTSRGQEERVANGSKTPMLDTFAYDLTAAAIEGKLDPVVCRDKVIDRLAQILGRRKKNNPVLIGEPGVGKSAIVEGMALRLSQKKGSPTLQGKRILSLDLGSLVAGTKYRGQFEERIKTVLAELRRNKDIILFIDEIHTLVGAGAAGGNGGSLDAANMLKPALARGEIQCIGASTLDEYREYIEKDGALERRFQKILVETTNYQETLDILQSLQPKYEQHHSVTYTPQALEACVRLSNRYITDRCQPDKAVDVLDEAGSRVHIENMVVPPQIVQLENQIEEVVTQKRAAVHDNDYATAAALRDQERTLSTALVSAKDLWQKDQQEHKQKVTEEIVAEVVSLMTAVPVKRVSESETLRLLNMSEFLKSRLIGQDNAVDAMVRAIQRNRAGLKDPNKPIGTFIFLGPTGVGKTQLAKLIAQYMFDSVDNLVRIDMSEYMEKFAVSRLIGAPPGYVGYDEGGQLTERIRRKPYAVVLLDEIEKAHSDIFNLLLQVFDEGRLTDSNGRHVDFRNTVIIMTSNIGSRELKEFGAGVGFATSSSANAFESGERARSIIDKALGKLFTPEFLNRVDEQILFQSLDKEAIFKIIDIELDYLYNRLQMAGFSMELSDEAKHFVAEQGFDPQFGARPLKRAIQKYLEDPLSEAIIRLQPPVGTVLHVTMNKEGNATLVDTLANA